MELLGIDCTVLPSNADESHPEQVDPHELPLVLAARKADALMSQIGDGAVLITADTVVVLEGKVLEKPSNLDEARTFLKQLSGKWHTVFSGFVIRCSGKEIRGVVPTKVHIRALTSDEIDYYITAYPVLDKAGAYGIQDWIGAVAVDQIYGSYSNVVGLPTAEVYRALIDILLQL